jgi:hypothetical protein
MSWESVTLVLTIPTAGTPVQISATRLLTKSFLVEGDNSNAQAIYVGDSTVDALSTPKRGHRVAKNEVYGASSEEREYYDLSKWYVDALQNNSVAQVSYLKKI